MYIYTYHGQLYISCYMTGNDLKNDIVICQFS